MNRRVFLLSSAVAVSAQPSQVVGTGMIGVGNRGSHLLRGVLQQNDAKVLAVCDIKPDRLDKAATAAAKENPKTYTEWRKVIERKDIDAVFIATPPHLHSEMAVAALQSGKHVYCEKPIGVTPAQVRAVIEAAKKANKVFVPGQQLRSVKEYQQAIAKIREGVIGDVIMLRAQRHAPATCLTTVLLRTGTSMSRNQAVISSSSRSTISISVTGLLDRIPSEPPASVRT